MARRLLAALVFLVFAGVVFWFALVHTVHRGTLAVPDLGEQTLEEARQRVHDLGLELTVESVGSRTTKQWTLRELLPDAFRAGDLVT